MHRFIFGPLLTYAICEGGTEDERKPEKPEKSGKRKAAASPEVEVEVEVEEEAEINDDGFDFDVFNGDDYHTDAKAAKAALRDMDDGMEDDDVDEDAQARSSGGAGADADSTQRVPHTAIDIYTIYDWLIDYQLN